MELNSDIQALLDHALNDLEKIKTEYKKSLNEKEISPSLRIAIKNCLENVRSSLDYLGNQIFEENCNRANSKTYFPIFSKDKISFEKFMGKYFPDLKKSNSKLYAKLESIQFYNNKNENEWMKDLVDLVNENKHRKLSPQKKVEKKELNISSGKVGIKIGDNASIRMGSGTSIRMGGKTIYGGQTLSADNPNIRTDPGVDVKRIIWIDFQFDELQKSVIPTISEIIDGAQKLVNNFKK